MPELFKFLLRNAALGFCIGAVCAVLAVDLLGILGPDAMIDPTRLGMVALFTFLMGLSGAATQIAIALFLPPNDPPNQ